MSLWSYFWLLPKIVKADNPVKTDTSKTLIKQDTLDCIDSLIIKQKQHGDFWQQLLKEVEKKPVRNKLKQILE